VLLIRQRKGQGGPDTLWVSLPDESCVMRMLLRCPPFAFRGCEEMDVGYPDHHAEGNCHHNQSMSTVRNSGHTRADRLHFHLRNLLSFGKARSTLSAGRIFSRIRSPNRIT